jgi:hypothetical protein
MPPKLFDLVDYLLLSVFRDINDDGERSQRRIRLFSRYIRRYISAALLNVVNDIHFPAWDLDVDAFHFSSLTVTRMAAAMLECRPVLRGRAGNQLRLHHHSVGRIDEHCNAGHAGEKFYRTRSSATRNVIGIVAVAAWTAKVAGGPPSVVSFRPNSELHCHGSCLRRAERAARPQSNQTSGSYCSA